MVILDNTIPVVILVEKIDREIDGEDPGNVNGN